MALLAGRRYGAAVTVAGTDPATHPQNDADTVIP